MNQLLIRSVSRLLVCGLATLLAAWPATAQSSGPAYLVTDLASGEQNGDAFPVGNPRFRPTELGGAFYFAAQHSRYGVELWRSDGTADGTELVADLCPGPCSSHPHSFQVYRGGLYFVADDGVLGQELFVLRPGRAPERFVDVCPGRCSGFLGEPPVGSLHAALGQLFLVATDGDTGQELRVLGPGRRVRLVADLCPGACSTIFRQLEQAAGLLYFDATGTYAGHGPRIFRTDGTRAGTVFLLNGDEAGASLATVGRRIVASGSPPGGSHGLWALDGTADGTRPIAELDVRYFLGVFAGKLYLTTEDAVYRTDGTAAGTRVFLPRRAFYGDFAVADGRMFFFVEDVPGGVGLWASDGTAAGSHAVVGEVDLAGSLVAAGERVFFFQRGHELWVADRGTGRRLLSADGATLDLAAVGDRVFFIAPDPAAGRELWTSDGSEDGTTMLADLHRGPASSHPSLLTATAERLVFAADVGGPGVWSSDGTADGTVRVPEGPVRPVTFFPFEDGLLYCAPGRGVPGLWQTDGTVAGTFRRVPGLVGCEGFLPFGGELLFAAGLQMPSYDDPPVDVELWTTDGSEAGTRLVQDIEPAIAGAVLPRFVSSRPRELTEADDGVAVFTAFQLGQGDELWRTDGSSNGTRGVRKLCPETVCRSDPGELVRLGRRVVFSAHRPDDGREPWVTDGRARGTRRLASLNPGIAGSDPHGFTVLGDEVVFFARQGRSEKLWKTDGTPAGTRVVRQLAFAGQPSFVTEVERVGDLVYFTLSNRRTGAELWVTDGTRTGTRQVTEIAPGAASAFPSDLTALDGFLVFAASDGANGKELWVSDGTAEGTRMVQDLEPGAASSAPQSFTAVGNLLFFRADTSSGSELWAVPRDRLAPPSVEPAGAAKR